MTSILPAPIEALLRPLLAQLDLAEAALRQGEAESLPVRVEALARAVQDFQKQFAALPAQDAEAPDWRHHLGAVGTRLQGLQQQLQVQGGAVNRALATLFPAETGNAYARLGGRNPLAGGLPRVSNNTSFKA